MTKSFRKTSKSFRKTPKSFRNTKRDYRNVLKLYGGDFTRIFKSNIRNRPFSLKRIALLADWALSSNRYTRCVYLAYYL